MIPLSIYCFLVIVFFAMGLCAFILENHEMYANLLFAVGSSVLGWYLSISTLVGNVGYQDVETITAETINGTTEMVYTMVTVVFQNTSLAYMISGVSSIMTIYAIFISIGIAIDIVRSLEQ